MKNIYSIIFIFLGLLFSQELTAQEKCVCGTCKGEGMVDGDWLPCHFCTEGYNTCNTCHGDGTEACYRCNETGIVEMTCTVCNGAGKMNEETCAKCGGDGLEDQACLNCEGRGWNNCHSCGTEGRFVCNMCGGEGGKIWRNACPTCNGSGEVDCK